MKCDKCKPGQVCERCSLPMAVKPNQHDVEATRLRDLLAERSFDFVS